VVAQLFENIADPSSTELRFDRFVLTSQQRSGA
jgi:hypothetical protein